MDHEPHTATAVESVVCQFDHLERALIDASSVIYMVKGGYFHRAANALELHAPERVIEETGYRDLDIQPIRGADPLRSADDSLVQCAFLSRWPVITEDGGIIRQLETLEITYFNALMILEFLFFKHLISPEEHFEYLQQLLQHAWYSPDIVEFGKAVHQSIEEEH